MPRRYGYGGSVVVGALGFGVTLLGFAASQTVLLSSLCALCLGVCLVTYQTQNQTLLQILAPSHLRGRVMSIYLLNRGLVPLGTLLAGALAEHLGGPLALQIMSLAAIGVVLAVITRWPHFCKLQVDFRTAGD
jgi:MFS family permease